MRVRLRFGLCYGLLVERRQLGEKARWRGFSVLNLEKRHVGEVPTDRTVGDKVFWRRYIQNLILFYIELDIHIAEF